MRPNGMRIVGGEWRGRALLTPDSDKIRPTSDRAREAVFNILNSGWHLPDDAVVLDVCCGTGALGLEALSRGAAHTTFIDKSQEAMKLVQANLQKLRAEDKGTVLYGDVVNLPPAPRRHGLVFIDPPYNLNLASAALLSLDLQGWLESDAVLVVETAADERLTVPATYRQRDERRYGAAKVTFLEYLK